MPRERTETPLLTETGMLGWLFAQHIRDIGDAMGDALRVYKPSADRLISYRMMVGHAHDLLSVDMDEQFHGAYNKIVVPEINNAPVELAMSNNLVSMMKYHNASRKWLRLIILQARKCGYLSTKKIHYPKGGELWNSLMSSSGKNSRKK